MGKKAKQRRPSRGSDQFIVRFPDGMRDEIAQKADENGRSMNAEVIARLGASFEEVLSWEGMVQVSKRMEAAASAFEQLFFDVRDDRTRAAPEQTPPVVNWKGFLRLALVTCPAALYPVASHGRNISRDIGLVPGRAIDIVTFVPRVELDPLYVSQSYYLVPDGKVGHDAFAVIRETMRATNMVAIGRVKLTNGERLIAIDVRDKGMVGMLLRHESEVRNPAEYFDDIQDGKVTNDMIDLAKHIVESKSGHFEPHELEEHYNKAPTEPVNEKLSAEPASNVINLIDALRKSAA